MKPLKGKRMGSATCPVGFSCSHLAAFLLPIPVVHGTCTWATCDRRTSGGQASSSVGAGCKRLEEGCAGHHGRLLSLGLARPVADRGCVLRCDARICAGDSHERSGMSTVADGTPVRSNRSRSIERRSHTTRPGC